MSLIGNPLISTAYQTDTFSGDNSTVAYTLSLAPASHASIAVYISGLYQTPGSAYTITGTTITFTGAPPTGTNNIQVLHLGVRSSTLVPVPESLTPAMLNNANVIFWSMANTNVGIGNTAPRAPLTIGTGSGTLTTPLIQATGNANSFLQINAQNLSGGNNASTDLVLARNDGTDIDGYIDMGINSNTYAQPAYSIMSPKSGYLYVNGGDLTIGTQTAHNILFHTGNTTANSERMKITSSGLVVNGSVTFADNTQFNTAASFGMRNKIINGGFDFWQRTTSGSVSGSGYPAPDRWQWIFDGTPATTGTVSRQTFTPGQTDVPGNPKYFLQYSYSAVNTPNNYFRQPIEGVGTFAGQTCTFSFWARCTSGTIACQFQNQQEFGSGGSPSAGVYGIGTANFTLTTTWQRFTFTHTMPSISGKTVGTTYDGNINPSVYFPTNASGTVQFANMQLEEGSVATPFERRHLSTELALCQRYYEIIEVWATPRSGDNYSHTSVNYRVTKRSSSVNITVISNTYGQTLNNQRVNEHVYVSGAQLVSGGSGHWVIAASSEL